MRRSEHYTAASDAITAPGPDVYHKAYTELSLFAKIIVVIRAWFQGETVELAVRHREHRALCRKMERDFHDIIDPGVPMLLDGFAGRLMDLAKRMSVVKTVVEEATGERAGRFLKTALKTFDAEIAEQLETAVRVPEELRDDHTVTLAAADQALKDQVQQALQVNQAAILRILGPVWSSLIGLKHLAQVPLKDLLPSGTRDVRIPLRLVRDDLIRLHQELEFCRQHQQPRALDIAAEFTTQRLGRSFSLYRGLWEIIDDLVSAVPFLDIIRLALEEPRATIQPVKHAQDWWGVFEQSWMESLEAGSELLRHRSFRIESILHDDFAVVAPAITWVPASLYQRTVGALRRLASSTEFRLTRVFVGTLAREEGLLRPASRKDLLNAHVQLDQQLDKLEDLIGSGDDRGKIGEEVKRLNAGGSDASLVRIQMTGVMARYRPTIRVVIGEALDALESIHRVCSSEERTIVKGVSRLNTALADTLGDVTPRYALDLIIHRYTPLTETLRGLAAIERELTAGTEPEPEELAEAVQ